MSVVTGHFARLLGPFLAPVLAIAVSPAFAHPGSGIVVDRQGQVDFVVIDVRVVIDHEGRLVGSGGAGRPGRRGERAEEPASIDSTMS